MLEYRPDSDQFRVLLTLQFWLVFDWSAFLSEHQLDVNFGQKEVLNNLACHSPGSPGGNTEGQESLLFTNNLDIRRTMSTRLKPIPTSTIDHGTDEDGEEGGKKLPELLTLEDGPAFRTRIKDLEARNHGLKRSFKSVIKALEDLLDPKSLYEELSRACDGALVENPNDALASITSHLKRVLAKQDANDQDFRRRLVELVLEPLRSHYLDDIKPTEARKRDWEQRSTAYYATVQRYLVKGKHTRKKTNNAEDDDTGSANEHTVIVDAKFAARKSAYEADRVEYARYLWELHDVLPKKLALYLKTFIELFYAKSAIVDGQHWEELRAGFEGLRGQLDVSKSLRDEHLAKLQTKRDECLRKWHLQIIGQPHDGPVNTQDESTKEDTSSSSSRYKEGFLYCATKTTLNKSWNRYWCILTNGVMAEHHFDEQSHRSDGSDKRTALRLHHSYNLALCTVKASSGQGTGNSAHISYQGRRRFCLEVISAQGWLRVYQAVSEEERTSWIAAIQSQITEWLEGKHGQVRVGQHEPEPVPSLALTEEISPSFYRTADELLDALWTADSENAFCADCGAPKPDWCSINLGALLCIECAAVHRSLGTHISKIRSIRLDRSTFAPELVDLLMSTGNRVAKAIWEARMPPAKISGESTREERERFIREKYEARAFCLPHHRRSLPSLAFPDSSDALKSTGSSRRASIRQ